jgi:hypothetical protein
VEDTAREECRPRSVVGHAEPGAGGRQLLSPQHERLRVDLQKSRRARTELDTGEGDTDRHNKDDTHRNEGDVAAEDHSPNFPDGEDKAGRDIDDEKEDIAGEVPHALEAAVAPFHAEILFGSFGSWAGKRKFSFSKNACS